MRLPDSTGLSTLVAYVWPSSRKIALRCYLHDKAGDLVPVAEFPVENPAYGTPRTTLTPDAPPASGRNGDLVVTFEGYGYGPLPPRPHWHRRATTRPLPFLRLRTWEGGKPSSGWQVRRITLSNGAFNDFSYDTLSYRDGNQEIVPLTWTTSEAAEMPCVLWPGSPAWKIQLVMGIRAGIELPPEEVCQVNRIVIRGRGATFLILYESRAWHHYDVNITCTSDVGVYTNWLRSANGVLRVSLGKHLPESMLGIVDARDDRGVPVTIGAALPESYGYHGERMDTVWHVPIYLPEKAQRLSLSLGVRTNRVVEFVAPAPDFPPARPFVIPEAKP